MSESNQWQSGWLPLPSVLIVLHEPQASCALQALILSFSQISMSAEPGVTAVM